MTLGDYNAYRGWGMPKNEDPAKVGYLVEYPDDGNPNHPDHKGYISWSPEAPFDDTHREVDGLNFGMAIEAAKLGHKIARAGWNGKDMFVVYQKGYPDGIPANKNTSEAFSMREGSPFYCGPYFAMKPANGPIVVGWLASQTDMLADDWIIIE